MWRVWVCETGAAIGMPRARGDGGWLKLDDGARGAAGNGGESAESQEGEFGAEVSAFLSSVVCVCGFLCKRVHVRVDA